MTACTYLSLPTGRKTPGCEAPWVSTATGRSPLLLIVSPTVIGCPFHEETLVSGSGTRRGHEERRKLRGDGLQSRRFVEVVPLQESSPLRLLRWVAREFGGE